MAKRKRSLAAKLGSLGTREQMLILTGSLLVATLALAMVPQNVPKSFTPGPPNELERREALANAADAYMLAETTEERQAAARRLHSVRVGLESQSTPARMNTPQQALNLLRFILILTILGIGFRLLAITIAEMKIRQSQKA